MESLPSYIEYPIVAARALPWTPQVSSPKDTEVPQAQSRATIGGYHDSRGPRG